uniref:C2H2-type domain-containing protein n=1 Tax=Pseudonaja textilis TaxID=8673 RepID=A0A670ZWK3_PSETE
MPELASPPGEKPFPFPVWEESSGDENGLVIHSQVEEEEHKCAMCGKSFSQPLGLLRHQKQQHAGERAFMCPECGRGFSLKHNLIIHQDFKLWTRGKYSPLPHPRSLAEHTGNDLLTFSIKSLSMYCIGSMN